MSNNVLLNRFRNGVSFATPPLFYLVLFVLLIGLWSYFALPSPRYVYDIIVGLFDKYGIVIVAFAALIEGLVLVSLYFPGSGVILIGVASSQGDPLRAVFIVSVVTICFAVAANINYALGFYGIHGIIERFGGRKILDGSRKRYEKFGVLILIPSFIHPNLGGFMSVASGIARLRWRRFFVLSIISLSVWNVMWGIVAYNLSEVVEGAATQPGLVLTGLTIWAFVAFCVGFVKKIRA